ncbi:MAG: hypothetical protein COV47_02910 [Candidatus Diapherotrites archaeon CG11_big_fil_rev_8_21_14_0_20_37_9]|nr:MAG: hypothetical protein COV47_02910 [Candidatus Diapherotrites archaeon CG11_big_fil_rev_8_21_14_0_20_37_9]
MDIPLKNRLRKRSQIELAELQDEAVDILYTVDPKAVFHGGTAIWRCYNGNRFSEDLDFYTPAGKNLEEKLSKESAKRGLILTKFRKTENSIYSRISDTQTEVSLELTTRTKKCIPVFYKKADGNTQNVLSLTPEELIIEKAKAFSNRKLIRDIYDVYFLLNQANIQKVKTKLSEIMRKSIIPVDEKNLKALLYSGAVPSFKHMESAIKRAVK